MRCARPRRDPRSPTGREPRRVRPVRLARLRRSSPAIRAARLVSVAADPAILRAASKSVGGTPATRTLRPLRANTASGCDSAPERRTSPCDVPLIARSKFTHGASAARSASATTRMSMRAALVSASIRPSAVNVPSGSRRESPPTPRSLPLHDNRPSIASTVVWCCCHVICAGLVAAIRPDASPPLDVSSRAAPMSTLDCGSCQRNVRPLSRACWIGMRGSEDVFVEVVSGEPGQFPSPDCARVSRCAARPRAHRSGQAGRGGSPAPAYANVLRGEEGRRWARRGGQREIRKVEAERCEVVVEAVRVRDDACSLQPAKGQAQCDPPDGREVQRCIPQRENDGQRNGCARDHLPARARGTLRRFGIVVHGRKGLAGTVAQRARTAEQAGMRLKPAATLLLSCSRWPGDQGVSTS